MDEQTEVKQETETKPFIFDLSADDVRYYIGVEHNGRHLSILAHMKRYIPGEMVKLLTERESEFVNSDSDTDAMDLMAPGASEANREFFDRHMIGIEVREAEEKPFQKVSPKIIEKLDAMFKIRPLIIRYGYLNVIEEPIKATGEFILEEEFGDTVEKLFSFKVVDPLDLKEKEIKALFVCRMPNAQDRRVWDQCAKTQALKKGGHRIRYNYSRIEHLANSMIVGIKSGFVLAGDPINETNRDGRDGWLERLDYIFKYRLMDSIFGLASEKNA